MAAADDNLRSLLHDATVWVHRPRTAGDRGAAQLWGSGFFVAPGRVVTCAHVLAGAAPDSGVWRGDAAIGITYSVPPGRGNGSREATVTGRLLYCLPEDVRDRARQGSWPTPDLAVIGLTEEVEHPCVWLSDLSTPPSGTSGRLVFRGFRVNEQGVVGGRTGDCTVAGIDEPHEVRLGIGGGEIKPGLSGGPVADLGRGAVVAVVKGRRNDRDGGTSVQVTALRELRSVGPADRDPYQELIRSHDRWHWAVQQRDRGAARTWAEEQSKLPNSSRDWRPHDRVEALGLLAELPDAPDSGTVLRLVDEASPNQFDSRMAWPGSWRDGAGLLYDPVGKGETEAVLGYLMRVARSVHGHAPTPAEALRSWVLERAEALPEPVRDELRSLAAVRERVEVAADNAPPAPPLGTPAPATAHTDEPPPHSEPAPDPAPEPAVVLLEFRDDWWLEDQYDWTVRLVGHTGDVELVAVGQQLTGAELREPPREFLDGLSRAFLWADAGDYIAPLEILVPQRLFDVPFDAWRVDSALSHDTVWIGAVRPVSIVDRDSHGPDSFTLSRGGRWRRIIDPRPSPHPRLVWLDALDLPPDDDVVLFHCGPVHTGPAGVRLRHALDAGFTTVIWQRAETSPEARRDCEHGIRRMLGGLRGTAEVPAAVQALRARNSFGPEPHWSRNLAVLHHDPGRQRATTTDLLDTP